MDLFATAHGKVPSTLHHAYRKLAKKDNEKLQSSSDLIAAIEELVPHKQDIVSAEEADLVTSEVAVSVNKCGHVGCFEHSGSTAKAIWQAPVLDIDWPAALIPSATPGHYHLYIDKPMPPSKYWKLLDVLAECGIIEPGYASASKARGYTALRVPWKPKTFG